VLEPTFLLLRQPVSAFLHVFIQLPCSPCNVDGQDKTSPFEVLTQTTHPLHHSENPCYTPFRWLLQRDIEQFLPSQLMPLIDS